MTDKETMMKPGYKTSEFWLKLMAVILTALYASGIIPTAGTAATIAAIVATVLTSLGYTVARTLLKSGGIALLALALFIDPLSGCAAAKHEISVVKDGAVSCAKADLPAIKAYALQLGASVLVGAFAESPNWAALWRATAAKAGDGVRIHGLAIAACAFKSLVDSLENVAPPSPIKAMTLSDAMTVARTDPIGIGLMELENFKTLNGIGDIQ